MATWGLFRQGGENFEKKNSRFCNAGGHCIFLAAGRE